MSWLLYFSTFLPFTKGEQSLKAIEGVGFLVLLLFFLHHAFRIQKRGVLRPDFTVRAIVTLTAAVLLIFTTHYNLLTTHQQFPALLWATAIFLLPGFVALAVYLAGIPFVWQRQKIIAQAKRLRAARTQLTVVGITGSYGKTSTKHFLEQILTSAGKKVAATEAHHNTPIGISQDLLAQLKPEVEIYVAELGAYRRGEIKELADIVQPTIGVITAIGNQHLDLFGSQENILKAKWELIESLPENGIAVLNADDLRLQKAASRLTRNIVWFSAKRKADTWVTHVSIQATKIMCTMHLREFSRSLALPVASEALLGSALAAASAALALDIAPEKIAEALEKLAPFSRTMEILPGKNGAVVLDDSYSANEHGTLLAIRHLARFPHPDKRIAFLPFLELGKDTAAAHQRVVAAAKTVGAKLFIYEKDPQGFAQEISAGLSKETVILLEGRLPDVVRKAVLA